MSFFFALDMLGTVAFAISGVLVAMDKRLDLFGILIIALVTAIGGGTLRDLLIGNVPVGWMNHTAYLYAILGAVGFAVLLRNQLKYLRRSLFLFDTIGIGLYTLIGIEQGLLAGLDPGICIILGTLTACFGGVVRDTLCNEIPVIFRKEIYATACIAGGLLYFALRATDFPEVWSYVAGILFVILIRLLAVRFGIALPEIYRKNPKE